MCRRLPPQGVPPSGNVKVHTSLEEVGGSSHERGVTCGMLSNLVIVLQAASFTQYNAFFGHRHFAVWSWLTDLQMHYGSGSGWIGQNQILMVDKEPSVFW